MTEYQSIGFIDAALKSKLGKPGKGRHRQKHQPKASKHKGRRAKRSVIHHFQSNIISNNKNNNPFQLIGDIDNDDEDLDPHLEDYLRNIQESSSPSSSAPGTPFELEKVWANTLNINGKDDYEDAVFKYTDAYLMESSEDETFSESQSYETAESDYETETEHEDYSCEDSHAEDYGEIADIEAEDVSDCSDDFSLDDDHDEYSDSIRDFALWPDVNDEESEEEELNVLLKTRRNLDRKAAKAKKFAAGPKQAALKFNEKTRKKGKGKQKAHILDDKKPVDEELFKKVMQSFDRYLRWLRDENGISQFSFELLPRQVRKVLHSIANKCGCVSKSHGHAHERYMIVKRTPTSRYPSEKQIKIFKDMLSYTRRSLSGFNGSAPRERRIAPYRKGKSENYRDKQKDETVPAHGKVVGGDAQPINESNKGHQLLLRMGWSPGESLGSASSSGIKEPVAAVVRKRGVGLGY